MADQEGLNKYWWEESKSDLHDTLFGIVRFLDQNQSYIQEANLRHMRLYGNLNVMGLSSAQYAQVQGAGTTDRVTLNVVQSMCDTVTQKIAKNRPKPTFLTSGGDYGLKRKATLLEKFVQGQFYALKMYEHGPRVFLDAAVFGTGALKIFRQEDKIAVERVFIDELTVDNGEAIYGKPRSLYQRKFMPKEVMIKLYPQYKDKILNAKRAEQQTPTHSALSNNILVIEAWHLPSGENGKDGRHVICIENEVLFDEKYEKSYFPFVFQKWNPRLLGFWGQGLAEQLVGLQVEINKILRTIQTAFHLFVPKVLIENGSKIVKAQINNEVGGLIHYTGTPPQMVAPAPIASEIFSHLQNLYQKAYEIAGVSQLSAHSQKPAGLDSGKALRAFNDIEAERFILIGQAYEQFYMEATCQIIDLAKEIYQDLGSFGVTVKGRKFIEKIDWKDIDLEDDEYFLQCFPTSMLSSTPAGRLQDVTDLIQAGFIDQANGLRLLDYPDLESYMNLANAAIEDIESLIEMIIDKGLYQAPEPEQNLSLGIKMIQSAYLRAKTDNVEEDRLELLRRWMTEAKALMDSANPAPQAPMLPGGAPQAVPQAAPTSPLLPNAPGGALPG